MTNTPLSEREEELVRLVATGASNKEISQDLNISVNTVKVHLRNIYSKLNVASRTEAAMWAVQIGLVETSGDVEVSEYNSTEHGDGDRSITWINRVPSKFRLWVFLSIALLLVVIGFGVSQIISPARSTPEPGEIVVGPEFEESRWTRLADMPTARAGLAAVAYDNQIYAIAGEGNNGVVDVNERYDPTSDTWAVLNPKPIAVADVHAGVVGGKIYIPGGRLKDGTVTDVLEIYDPRSDAWDRGEPIPEKLSAYALVTFEGRIYIFGGWDGEDYSNSVYVFEPIQNRWKEGSPMPTARAFSGATEIGGNIYVVGGRSVDRILSVNERFVPVTDNPVEFAWLESNPLKNGRYSMGITDVADMAFVYGGYGIDSIPQLEQFTHDGEWLTINSRNEDQISGAELVSLDTKFYVLGGILNNNVTPRTLSYTAFYSVNIPIIE
jgi:DNA-binding CsgD family transcriptional regulator